MLARYKIYRGRRPAGVELPRGIRQDTRKHTRHILRPTAKMVATFLGDGSESAWQAFREEYLRLLEGRFDADRRPFDELAELAKERDVYLGCSCPTQKQPDVHCCHTLLALEFMGERYGGLSIQWPADQ